jgi:hypothetical protein
MSDQAFNPKEHLIQIKSGQNTNDYLPVQWRLVWFREKFPHGTIETEMVLLDLDRDTEEEVYAWNSEKRRNEKVVKHAKGIAIFKTTVKDGMGGIAIGTKMEKAASFGDFMEKAETGSIGRALSALGYGTQFAHDEFDEQHRIVDSPVTRTAPPMPPTSVENTNTIASTNTATSSQSAPNEDSAATERQLISIRKLYEHLGKSEPETLSRLSYIAAQQLIKQLTSEYRENRNNNKAS